MRSTKEKYKNHKNKLRVSDWSEYVTVCSSFVSNVSVENLVLRFAFT